MEVINTILKILPFLVPLLLLGVWYQNVRNKKLGIKEEPSRFMKWFKTTQIYSIFVYRVSLRPSSLFFYWMFIFPAFLILIGSIGVIDTKSPIPLKKMKEVKGYITKVVWTEAGRGDDYIKLKTDDGKEEVYLIRLDKKIVDLLNNIKDQVTVYSYERYYVNIFQTKHIAEIKYNNEFLVGYDYKLYLQRDNIFNSLFYNTWFGLKIAFIGFFFILLLNNNQKPISTLNRMKKYLKNQKKEEK
jgi:hypothetical protein